MSNGAVLLDDQVINRGSGGKGTKAEIHWSEQREYVLVSVIKNRQSHWKTKGMKMEDKKQLAFNDLRAHSSFSDVKEMLTANGMMAKYQRLKTYVKNKYSLDSEGANLSGLPENPPRLEALLYRMIVDVLETRDATSEKKKKEDDRAMRLKALQEQELARQVRSKTLSTSGSSDGSGTDEIGGTASSPPEEVDGKGKKKTTPPSEEDSCIHCIINKCKEGKLAREERAILLFHLQPNGFRHTRDLVEPKMHMVE